MSGLMLDHHLIARRGTEKEPVNTLFRSQVTTTPADQSAICAVAKRRR